MGDEVLSGSVSRGGSIEVRFGGWRLTRRSAAYCLVSQAQSDKPRSAFSTGPVVHARFMLASGRFPGWTSSWR